MYIYHNSNSLQVPLNKRPFREELSSEWSPRALAYFLAMRAATASDKEIIRNHSCTIRLAAIVSFEGVACSTAATDGGTGDSYPVSAIVGGISCKLFDSNIIEIFYSTLEASVCVCYQRFSRQVGCVSPSSFVLFPAG